MLKAHRTRREPNAKGKALDDRRNFTARADHEGPGYTLFPGEVSHFNGLESW